MPAHTHLFNQLGALTTEQRNRRSMTIDTLDIKGILEVINGEDRRIAGAVKKEVPSIAKAVEIVVKAFKKEGRLIYVGAGTSGRLGVLDAAECPPTFGTDHEMVQGIIAGGEAAMFRAQEGAEDREENGALALHAKNIGRNDVVCGIAASMRTPFVVGAMKEAKRRGARTIFVTTNPRAMLKSKVYEALRRAIDVAICVDVGPEVIMGSTRMKSGTAQKLVLNMITTASMIRLGKVYENMMIDLKMTNRKLEERARRVIMIATRVDYATASQALEDAGGSVKTAIVMLHAHVSKNDAHRRLERSKGFVRAAIGKQKK